ncbi:uncharacterized protein LOC134847945 isoform X2 [Symsagittifera roscoffensis]|uniref:uncharacterized protein LOC134847945 isoform X2 n=1 Tax=Symsagittifera roscoffensis TaxID=84072 RepID=UPI00307C57AC
MLQNLPVDIILKVCNFLSNPELRNFSVTSKNFHLLIKQYSLLQLNKDHQLGVLTWELLGRFSDLDQNPLLALFVWNKLSATSIECSDNISSLFECELRHNECLKTLPMSIITSTVTDNLLPCGTVLCFDSNSDQGLLCCYTSEKTLLMLKRTISISPSYEVIAQNESFTSAPIKSIQIGDFGFTIVVDVFGIMFKLCSETLRKIRVIDHRGLRCLSPAYGLFPFSTKFAIMSRDLVLFTCDETNSFGLWNLQTGDVKTFPGHILYNEKTVRIFPLGRYFLLVSQDSCFNVIANLYILNDLGIVQLVDTIGFITGQVKCQLKDVELKIEQNSRNDENRRKRPIKFALQI